MPFRSCQAKLSTGAESGSAGAVGNVAGGDRVFADLARTLLGETASPLASGALNLASAAGLHSFLERHALSRTAVEG